MLVGRTRGWVGCAGGADVAVEAATEVRTMPGFGVRGVAVSRKKRRGVGDAVLLGVAVGVGVTVGVLVMVAVGPVGVGKGP